MSPNTIIVAKGKMQYEYDEYHLDYFMGLLNHGKSDCRIEILLTYTYVYICTWYLKKTWQKLRNYVSSWCRKVTLH